jgi:ribonuclease HI
MPDDMVYIYTDASFSKLHEIAIVGYLIFNGQKEHESLSALEVKLNLFQISETNNIRAEIRSALLALKSSQSNKKILLYSDCQTLTGLPARREKLEATSFISQSKNQLLPNADLYKEFYSIYDKYLPEILWVKGHSSRGNPNKAQETFSYLDKAVRKKLRSTVSSD